MKNAADRSRLFPLWLSYGELAIVGLLAPWFIFPDPALTPWLMFVPVGLWLLRWIVARRLTVRTPLDVPLLLMALTMCVSILVTVDPLRSFPKITGVYYGFIVFYAMANHVRGASALRIAVAALVVAGSVIAIVALLDTNWGGVKIPVLGYFLQPLYQQMPDVMLSLPRAESGFNSNQVGGTLALLLPLQASLALHAWRGASERRRTNLKRFGLACSCAITGLALILTQSRGAWTSVLLALIALLALQGRRSRLMLVLILVVVASVVALTLADPATPVSDDELDRIIALSGRPEIWRRSVRVIRDHPLTGIGFDNLTAIVHARYPTFTMPADSEFAHAHNMFFQVALDLGLPGLIAFLSALLCTLWQLACSYRSIRDPFHRAVIVGLALGFGAQMVFGMADAIALGQKPGLLLWVYLGLATVMNFYDFEPATCNL